MMGAERRSMAMTEEEKLATAYHEAGHAIVNLIVPQADPLHKVTIIPRGRALGVTMSLPERDKYSLSKIELTSKIAMMFGGRVGYNANEQEVFLGHSVTQTQNVSEATAQIIDEEVRSIVETGEVTARKI